MIVCPGCWNCFDLSDAACQDCTPLACGVMHQLKVFLPTCFSFGLLSFRGFFFCSSSIAESACLTCPFDSYSFLVLDLFPLSDDLADSADLASVGLFSSVLAQAC